MNATTTTYPTPAADAYAAAQAAYDAALAPRVEARKKQRRDDLLTEANKHYDLTGRPTKADLAVDMAHHDMTDTPETEAVRAASREANAESWVLDNLRRSSQRFGNPLDLTAATERADAYGDPGSLIQAAIDAAVRWHTNTVWAHIAKSLDEGAASPAEAARWARDMVLANLMTATRSLVNRSSGTGSNLNDDARVTAYSTWLEDAKYRL